jgi:hypothetical protein
MTTQVPTNGAEREQQVRQVLDQALARNGGNRSFRLWKAAAAVEIVQMVLKAARMQLMRMDLTADLDVVYSVRMPVPRWPVDGKLVIGHSAVFHLVYRDEWRMEPPPGWLPLGLFHPLDVFHPNARESLRGVVCLGDLPAGVAPKELILLGYYSLSLQDHSTDELDPHGILSAPACEFFRRNTQYLPLTRAGLFEPWEPEGDR